MTWFYELNPVWQGLIATIGTWFVTAMGAGLVVFTKRISQKLLDVSLGMAAGVMIAASFWSLLAPAIDMAEASYGEKLKWLPPLVGFLLSQFLEISWAVIFALVVENMRGKVGPGSSVGIFAFAL